jgi:hypothetical protein
VLHVAQPFFAIGPRFFRQNDPLPSQIATGWDIIFGGILLGFVAMPAHQSRDPISATALITQPSGGDNSPSNGSRQ